MKKLSGQCTLEEFFISMTKSDTLMNKYNGFIYEFNLFKKLRNDSFIKEILIKPIIQIQVILLSLMLISQSKKWI